jgi:hypothetical protein
MVDPYERFRSDSYAGLLRKLERGEHLPGEQLADALIRNRGQPIPDRLLDYLAAYLRGSIKRRRGRKAGGAVAEIRDSLAVLLHDRYMLWLHERERRLGLGGWSCVRGADWWEGPPHERAARMTVRHMRRYRLPACDWRHVLNLISSRK